MHSSSQISSSIMIGVLMNVLVTLCIFIINHIHTVLSFLNKKNIRLQIGLSGFYICFYTPSTCRVCTLLTIKQMLAWYRSILNTGRLRCLHGAGSHYPSVPFHLVSRRICVVNRSRAFLARSLRKPSLAIYAVQASIHIIKFHQVLLVTKSSSPKVVVELGTTKDYGGAKHLCNQRDGAFSI